MVSRKISLCLWRDAKREISLFWTFSTWHVCFQLILLIIMKIFWLYIINDDKDNADRAMTIVFQQTSNILYNVLWNLGVHTLELKKTVNTSTVPLYMEFWAFHTTSLYYREGNIQQSTGIISSGDGVSGDYIEMHKCISSPSSLGSTGIWNIRTT